MDNYNATEYKEIQHLIDGQRRLKEFFARIVAGHPIQFPGRPSLATLVGYRCGRKLKAILRESNGSRRRLVALMSQKYSPDELGISDAKAQELRVVHRVDHILKYRRACRVQFDGDRVYRAAQEGRPLELQKRLRWGVLAGALFSHPVGATLMSDGTARPIPAASGPGTSHRSPARGRPAYPARPAVAACLGSHAECLQVLLDAARSTCAAAPHAAAVVMLAQPAGPSQESAIGAALRGKCSGETALVVAAALEAAAESVASDILTPRQLCKGIQWLAQHRKKLTHWRRSLDRRNHDLREELDRKERIEKEVDAIKNEWRRRVEFPEGFGYPTPKLYAEYRAAVGKMEDYGRSRNPLRSVRSRINNALAHVQGMTSAMGRRQAALRSTVLARFGAAAALIGTRHTGAAVRTPSLCWHDGPSDVLAALGAASTSGSGGSSSSSGGGHAAGLLDKRDHATCLFRLWSPSEDSLRVTSADMGVVAEIHEPRHGYWVGLCNVQATAARSLVAVASAVRAVHGLPESRMKVGVELPVAGDVKRGGLGGVAAVEGRAELARAAARTALLRELGWMMRCDSVLGVCIGICKPP